MATIRKWAKALAGAPLHPRWMLDCWKNPNGAVDVCNGLLGMRCELEVGKS